MTDLTDLTNYVIKTIYNTEEYCRYRQLLEKVKQDEPLYQRVNELREKNFRLQQEDSENLLDMMDALTNEYEDVINIELVSDFLEAEVSLCRMIQTFNYMLVEGLNFD